MPVLRPDDVGATGAGTVQTVTTDIVDAAIEVVFRVHGASQQHRAIRVYPRRVASVDHGDQYLRFSPGTNPAGAGTHRQVLYARAADDSWNELMGTLPYQTAPADGEEWVARAAAVDGAIRGAYDEPTDARGDVASWMLTERYQHATSDEDVHPGPGRAGIVQEPYAAHDIVSICVVELLRPDVYATPGAGSASFIRNPSLAVDDGSTTRPLYWEPLVGTIPAGVVIDTVTAEDRFGRQVEMLHVSRAAAVAGSPSTGWQQFFHNSATSTGPGSIWGDYTWKHPNFPIPRAVRFEIWSRASGITDEVGGDPYGAVSNAYYYDRATGILMASETGVAPLNSYVHALGPDGVRGDAGPSGAGQRGRGTWGWTKTVHDLPIASWADLFFIRWQLHIHPGTYGELWIDIASCRCYPIPL